MVVRLARQSRGAAWNSIVEPLLRGAGIVLVLFLLLAALGLLDRRSDQHAHHRPTTVARW
jgi:hypothetical protein